MARTRPLKGKPEKAASRKVASKSAPHKEAPRTATPGSDTPTENGKKRKVDWATIDDTDHFKGFELKAVKRASKGTQSQTPKNTSPAHKKQKIGNAASVEREEYRAAPTTAEILQSNPFPDSQLSDTHYKVEPALEWESTQRYRKFTISEAEFEVGQVVFIKTTEDEFDPTNNAHFAFGRVLEVRAGDAAHVFLRIYYLYKPEELPGGRQPHHGDSELIASNHMDIIEALTVADRAEVLHWEEDPDRVDWPMKDQWFWRQTYDLGKPKAQQFSKLRPFCIDKAPCNPDEPLVNCPSCSGWLHARCLEDRAVKGAYEEHNVPVKGRPAMSKKKGAQRSSVEAAFTAHLTTQESGQVCLTVTDKRPEGDNKRWNVDVNCLLCKELIEKAATEVPEAPAEVTKVTNEITATSTPEPKEEEDEDEDSVIGEDPKSDDPRSETVAPDPFLLKAASAVPNVPAKRGRGRSSEFVDAKRGRGRPRKAVDASIAATEMKAPKKQGRGRPRKMLDPSIAVTEMKAPEKQVLRAKSPPVAKAKMKLPVQAEAMPLIAQEATPLMDAPACESVFQSGIRSVKRLLWRSS